MCESICHAYIDMIKADPNFNKTVLKTIMARNNYELGFGAMIDLSKYYDHLCGDSSFDDSFMHWLKTRYGITKEYLEGIDLAFNKINLELEATK